jgi:hypothetical protein
MPVDTVAMLRSLMARAYGINLKAMHIAGLTSLTSADLSLAQNGKRTLSYIEAKEIENLVNDCEALVEQAGVPINFRDTPTVKKLLEALHERQARPAVLEPSDWDLMRRVCGGEPATLVAQSMGITTGQLIERLEIANSRFSQTAAELRRSNNDQKALTDHNIASLAK